MEEILKILNKFNSFALFCHVNPDADALGSMNALYLVLKKLNKKAYMFCDSSIPTNLSFLNIKLEESDRKIQNCEVCIMLDCNSYDRIGKYAEQFSNSKLKLCLDHHQKSTTFFDYSLIDISCPSTCDLLYSLIKELNVKINSQIATNLYAGISSDTGCFKFSNTKAISHKNTYELLNYDFDLTQANYNMFSYKQKNFLSFYLVALKNTRLFFNGKVFVTYFKLKNYMKFKEICDNSVGFQIFDGIDGNEIRIKIIENEKNHFLVSFRSNKFANVCNIAKKFGGGGHVNASGCICSGSIKKILKTILKECKEELKL